VKSLAAVAIVLAASGCVIFIGVGVTELNYVSGHPDAYGPAKVIAWAAGGGVLVSAAIGLLGVALLREPN
jgi:hypothetical protein